MELIVRSGPDAGASIVVDRRITVGREGDFRLSDPTVSRMHAAVTPTSDGALLEDLGSTGGTVVDGTRLFGPVTLRGGEQVLLGSSIVELVVEAPAPAAAPEPAPVPEPMPAPVPPPAASPGPPLVPAAVPPPPTPSPVLPPPAPPAGKDRKKLMIAIAVVVAIVIAVVGFLLLSGGNDDAKGGGGGGGGDATGQDGGTGANDGDALAPLANLGALPGDLTADPSTWLVTLTWDDAPGALGLDHYEVSRNGKRIAAAVAEPTFVDDGVQPGQELDYEVIAVGSAGSTDPAAAVAVTPDLSVGDALVTGAWGVQMRITKSNLNDVGASARLTWDFEPTCSFGACDNSFSIRRTQVVGSTSFVEGSGATYSGEGSGAFLLKDCRNDSISETVTVTFDVKKAAVQAGVWAAQTFKGTLQETAVSAGCVTARRTFAITGTRV